MTCDDDPIDELFSVTVGDVWAHEFSRTAGDRVFVGGSLVVQIRAGSTESHALLASTANGEGFGDDVPEIDTTGTDLTADPPVIALALDTTGMASGSAVIEFSAEVDGVGEQTIMPGRRFRLRPQVAVKAVSS